MSGQEEKWKTCTYYKLLKGQSTSVGSGHYNRILFLKSISEKKIEHCNRLFCVIQNSTSNLYFFNRFSIEMDDGLCSTGSNIGIVNPDPIKNYMNGIPIISSDEQAIF